MILKMQLTAKSRKSVSMRRNIRHVKLWSLN